MDSVEIAIIKTLAFFDLYNRPLSLHELERFLWMKKTSIADIQKIIPSSDNIVEKEGWLFLKNRDEIVNIHKKRLSLEAFYWQKIKKYIRFLTWVPFIRLVAVCNNLAFSGIHTKSDIDLFIVIKKGRMWLTRFLITAVLHILGVRRHHHYVAGRFCLSFFVTDDALKMKNIAITPVTDVYLIFWILTMVPAIDRNIFGILMEKNRAFIEGFVPNFDPLNYISFYEKNKCMASYTCTAVKNCFEYILGNRLGDYLEYCVRSFLKRRALKKARLCGKNSNIIISDSMLKFHNIDRRLEIFHKWQENWSKYIKK